MINRKFVKDHLLSNNGNLNPRALEKYKISKDKAYQVYHGMSGPAQCKECTAPTTFLSFKKGYTVFCSKLCMARNKDVVAARRDTLTKNFGTAGFKSQTIQNKKKDTAIANYGTDHARQNKEYVAQLQTMFLKKYGVKNPANTDAAQQKRATTNLKKYGAVNPLSNPEIRAKILATNMEKYGVSTTLLLLGSRKAAVDARRDSEVYAKLDDTDWLEQHKNIPSTTLSESMGIAWSTILNYYKKHNIQRPHVIVSSLELKLIEFLKDIDVEYETSERSILDGKEIDVYLPKHKIGLEIDGLYWHSEEFIKDKFYHRDKSKLAQQKGIQLIHITDYEILNQFDIVKQRILSKIGKQSRVFARKCNIGIVDSETYSDFMSKYHIQGPASASVRIGLLFDNELTAVMSFSKARFNRNYEFELVRYASKNTVVGGASKLFSHFVSNYNPNSIISYADLRWNTGNVYEKLGMKLSHVSSPNYWYINNGQLKHRTQFQKHKLKSILAVYNDNLSEWENMKNNGYTRYWDCGNKVFTWNNLHDNH